MRYLFLIYTAVLLAQCKRDKPAAVCSANSLLAACPESNNGGFCTFGYKWGAGNPFQINGPNKPGPQLGNVRISCSIKDAGFPFETHNQSGLISTDWNGMPACAKAQVRAALEAWASVANISFIEKGSTETADISIVVGPINPGGVAFPNLKGTACEKLSGLVALKPSANFQCAGVYALALHEIGHALGLGHVSTNNIMNPRYPVVSLQDGDKAGVISIYGKK